MKLNMVIVLVEIKNIVICGSAKYMESIHILAKYLINKGYNVTDLKKVLYPTTFDAMEKLKNKEFYFNKIKNADLVLIYNKDGYVGLATAMEIQFSLDDNRHRPVRFLFEPEKIEFHALSMSTYYNVCVDSGWLHV